jgi:hypothetical protein
MPGAVFTVQRSHPVKYFLQFFSLNSYKLRKTD